MLFTKSYFYIFYLYKSYILWHSFCASLVIGTIFAPTPMMTCMISVLVPKNSVLRRLLYTALSRVLVNPFSARYFYEIRLP